MIMFNKKNIAIINIMIILFLTCACTSKQKLPGVNISENTIENNKVISTNQVFVVKNKNSIYYSNFSLGQKYLYNIDLKSNVTKKINEDIPMYLNIYNEYLVYSNVCDDYKLYCYDTKTGVKNRINDVKSKYNTIFNNDIYYLNCIDNKIYKVTMNKKEQEKVSDELVDEFCIYENNIYYINVADDGKLYRISLDGMNKVKITDYSVKFINICDQYIYLINVTDKYSIYKIRVDGKESIKINGDQSWNLVLKDNALYYSNCSDLNNWGSLYSINLSSNYECKKLVNEKFISINVIDDWLYYTNDSYTAKDDDLYLKRYNVKQCKSEYIK